MDVKHKGMIAWFIYNPVAANLLLAAILILGYLSFGTIRTEFMPKPESNILQVAAVYPGASPREVEQGLTLKIEDAIQNISGIKKVTSTASFSRSVTSIEVEDGFEVQSVLDRIKIAIDNISTFPNDVENVIVAKPVGTELALQVQLSGKLDEDGAKLLAEEIKRDMLASTSAKNITVWGTRPSEVSIEVSNEQLQRYNLTLREVAERIRTESVNLPSGSIKSDTGTLAIRVEGQAYKQKDFEKIVLLTSEDGRVVRLGDIAKVNDGFVSWAAESYFDGDYSVGLAIASVGHQDSIEVAESVKKYVKEKQKNLPDGVFLQTWADITYYLDSRLSMMTSNMFFGAVLVFIILAAFMEIRIAFWVMMGLPVCYMGAFIIMPLPMVDVSINMVSLFGFILVLGIIVDDAIVVGESVSSEIKKSGFSKESVLIGTERVALPAMFGVFTTIVAFLPTMFLEGPYHLLPYSVGAVVCLTLLFSLLESKLILPSHLADMNSGFWSFMQSKRQDRWQENNNKRLDNFVTNRYYPLLKATLVHRYGAIAGFFGLFIISLSLVANGIVKYELMPALPHDFLQVYISMGDGTTEKRTQEVMEKINDSLHELNTEYKKEYSTDVGLIKHWGRNNSSETGGKFFVELTKDEDREIDSFEIIERWREKVGPIPDASSTDFSAFRQATGARSVSYMLVSSDKEQLYAAADELKLELEAYGGLFDIHSSVEAARPEYVLTLKPKAVALGLSLAEISIQVKEAFYGIEAQRFQRNNEEVAVMVRYPEEGRRSLVDLEDMNIRTRDGRFIPLKSLADINFSFAESNILRVNNQAAAIVSAKVGTKVDNIAKISQTIKGEFFDALFKKYPDVSYKSEGAALEQEKIESDVPVYFMIALLAVFVFLAVPLQSYFQPIIIMSAIPFGIVGAIFGHLLMGYPISLMSLFGIIALSGVVVNDSLLMVDFVNRAVKEGRSFSDAVLHAGGERFRAIILTTATTFFGLLPMLIEPSLQAESMIPMAVSLGFGIVFATSITLLLVPCLYLALEDLKYLTKRAVG